MVYKKADSGQKINFTKKCFSAQKKGFA